MVCLSRRRLVVEAAKQKNKLDKEGATRKRKVEGETDVVTYRWPTRQRPRSNPCFVSLIFLKKKLVRWRLILVCLAVKSLLLKNYVLSYLSPHRRFSRDQHDHSTTPQLHPPYRTLTTHHPGCAVTRLPARHPTGTPVPTTMEKPGSTTNAEDTQFTSSAPSISFPKVNTRNVRRPKNRPRRGRHERSLPLLVKETSALGQEYQLRIGVADLSSNGRGV